MREPGEKKYLHVADYVEGLIREGGLKPGDKLPSDRDLAGKLSATRVTVSKGLQVLADKGILERKVGSGSYVAESQATRKAKEGKLLGMLVHARSDAYAMMMVKAINEAAARQGAKLLTSSADGFGEESIRAAQTLDNDGCSALIIPWIPYLDYSGLPSFASKCPLPFTLPALIQGLESHCFETKDTVGKGGVLGTRSLCEYIYCLASATSPSSARHEGDIAMRDNLAAYSEFICKKGLENTPTSLPRSR
jgi:DNA-binding transcriptional regulator YhcF (GntR family)